MASIHGLYHYVRAVKRSARLGEKRSSRAPTEKTTDAHCFAWTELSHSSFIDRTSVCFTFACPPPECSESPSAPYRTLRSLMAPWWAVWGVLWAKEGHLFVKMDVNGGSRVENFHHLLLYVFFFQYALKTTELREIQMQMRWSEADVSHTPWLCGFFLLLLYETRVLQPLTVIGICNIRKMHPTVW